MAVLSKGSLFEPQLVTDLINKVKGHSSVAKLCNQTPIPFNGMKEFIFTMDSDIDIVAENGAKSHGGISLAPVKIVPIKVEYGARISDEFKYAAQDEKIQYLKAFNDGFSVKLARGLDIMSMHGINPRTKTSSEVIGTNHFDSLVTQSVKFDAASVDENVEAAIALIDDSENEATGMAVSPAFRTALANLKNSANERLYPQLAWGGKVDSLNGLEFDSNSTVSFNKGTDRAIIGDFRNAFKWGYAKQIPLEIIEYGDPDNSGKDLKGYNQIYLRAEAYIGWGILDPSAFVRIDTVTV